MIKNNVLVSFIKNPIIKSLSFFLPLIVITSGLKIYGYVFAFILFLPNIYQNKDRLISFFSRKSYNDKLVIIYFSYLIFQSLLGAIYINDIRIIFFWIPFFLVTFYCYFNNIYDYKNNFFYKKNIVNIIFLSCIFYFILYMGLTMISMFINGTPFSIQDNIWVGGSTAFFISSVLFLCIFKKWDEIHFRSDLRYFSLIIIHNLFVTVHQSRLGFLNLLLFGIFILIRCISLKKIFNGLLILSISFYSYSFFNSNIAYSNNYLEGDIPSDINHIYESNDYPLISNYTDNNRNIFKEINLLIYKVKQNLDVIEKDQIIKGDSARMAELLIAKNHFDNLPLHKKLFGTGWYTTRITINETRNNFIDQNSYRIEDGLMKTNVVQLSGIVALLFDTGLTGLLITIILYLINLRILLLSKLDFTFKLFYISMLGVNFFCLFIGYSLVFIPFFLFFLPNKLLKN